MAEIILSEVALQDAVRLFDFLAAHDDAAAAKAGQAIAFHIARLERYPESVPAYDGEIRILSVPFGKRGYSVAYVFESDRDCVVILGIKHQSEEFFPFELL